MRSVLGIDAAWTATEPSGVALAVETKAGWRLAAVAPSYHHFQAIADGSPIGARPTGSVPDAKALLDAATALCGHPVDLVAIDMPLCTTPIIGRRASDNAISREYGGRGASTHSPGMTRPGKISDNLRQAFADVGYPLRTNGPVANGLIEVYPHPALLEWSGATQRHRYKHGKRARYWRDDNRETRNANIWREWSLIQTLLTSEFIDGGVTLPPFDVQVSKGWEWKAYEDMLDAIICAAVAIAVLRGTAIPFGDIDSAIWIPKRERQTPKA